MTVLVFDNVCGIVSSPFKKTYRMYQLRFPCDGLDVQETYFLEMHLIRQENTVFKVPWRKPIHDLCDWDLVAEIYRNRTNTSGLR